ncbi:MAG TPA: class I SAM-dependent methyltransferase [Stellaceae bacterium]|jgi:predicted O-methyltransferase YrrM|nr:class I SAM-dependent methyltransferase [Stellaceae bacterium]
MRPIGTLRRIVYRTKRLFAAAEGTDQKLGRIIEILENQFAASNLRFDHLTDEQIKTFSVKDKGEQYTLNSEPPRDGDIEFIERYCRNWQEIAHTYEKTLPDLRKAAQRLLQVLERPDSFYGISDDELKRIQDVEPEIACLVRQPLYFTEMFHGVSLRSDGGFEPLSDHDAHHLRAGGLLGIEDRRALREIYERLISNARSTIRVAEIGSAAGRGSTLIAGEYVKRAGGTLYCIDPWEGSWYFAFLAKLRIFALERTAIPIRSPSVPAASLFDDGSLDAVFVDGSHMYPDVLADIDAYLPKMRRGGLIFGHDLYDLPSRFDRNELLSIAAVNNADASYVNINGEVERVDAHPGVILAVQDRFGDDVELFGRGSVVWAKQV